MGIYTRRQTKAEGEDAERTERAGEDRQEPQLHSADVVVLAFGAASSAKPFELASKQVAGARLSSRLEAARTYVGQRVLVIGTGPSGMESAVRLCSSSYGAAHVILASHSRRVCMHTCTYTMHT